jgi:hypothetical protein
MKICFVLPTYNDEASLKELILNIKKILEKFSLYFIIVNDCSKDDFRSLSNISKIDLITLNKNQGSQKAISIGLDYIFDKKIDFDYLIVMDSDGEDKPEDLKLLIEESKKYSNNFIVFASRRKRSETTIFKFFYVIYKFIFKTLTGKKINFGNFSCVPKIFLEDIVNTPLVDFHYSAAIIKSKNKYKSVPCNKGKRYTGKSKMSFFNLFFHGMKSLSIFRREIFIRFLFYYLIVNCIFLFSIEANMIIKLNFVILSFFSIFFLYLNNLISKRFNKNDLIKNLNHNRLIKDIKSL